jgi:molybdopterin-binding protein
MQRASPSRSNGNADSLYRLQDAAKRLGISYPTLKQWIYKRKIRVAQTAGGHYRVPSSEIERLSLTRPIAKKEQRKLSGIDLIPARNKLLGTIVSVKIEGLMAQVTMDIGGQLVTAIMTRDSCRELNYKPGISAYAIVKATEVMIIRAGT